MRISNNNFLRFFSIFLSLVLVFSVFFVSNINAGDPAKKDNLSNAFGPKKIDQSASKMGFDVSGAQTPETIVGIVISAVLGFLGVIFIVLMVYGGILWMTAGGNDEKVGKAKNIIRNAAIGLVVVLISYSLSWLILNVFIAKPLTPIPRV